MVFKRLRTIMWCTIVLFIIGPGPAMAAEVKVLPPDEGVYHAAFPDFPDNPQPAELTALTQRFEQFAGKGVAIAVIANDWVNGISFPASEVRALHTIGKIPLIRMMPWSIKDRSGGRDTVYSFDRIMRGYFQSELQRYAQSVKAARQPVMIEFAPEVNGSWFPWNGLWNGAENTFDYGDPELPDGGERYQDTFRYVVDLFRSEGVNNVTWVFHVDAQAKPDVWWNAMRYYYPGDDYVDWIGVSVFGAQMPGDYFAEFSEVLNTDVYSEILELSETKPIAIVESATIEDLERPYRKAEWIGEAYASIKEGLFERLKAFTWWHNSSWIPSGTNDMRINSSMEALQAYQTMVADPIFVSEAVLSAPVIDDDAEKCKCGLWRNRYGVGCSVVRPESRVGSDGSKFWSFGGSTTGCGTEAECSRRFDEYLNDDYWCPAGWVLKNESD